MATLARIPLYPNQFIEKERPLLEYGELSASAFVYSSGIAGLRLKNSRGEVIALPFQGQQLWSVKFDGRDLTMKTMFTDPRPTREYLANYGAFLVHCGMTAMGGPSKEDTHPLHGELPHAPYGSAYLDLGQDERGAYLGLGGLYQHTIAFACNYTAEPYVKLYAGSTLLNITMTVTNLKNTEMEYMYMAHVNFRPVDNGRLVYSAPATPEYMRLRPAAAHLKFPPAYQELLDEIARDLTKHHIFTPGKLYDPEAVFYIRYLADSDGWAHSLQVLPDGSADYIAHRPDQLDKGVRWISRTPDQDCLGIVLPATAEADGYLKEKAKGNVKVLPAHSVFFCEVIAGAVSAAEAREIEQKIGRILAS